CVFPYSSHHRDLHSFPTRRSSDLYDPNIFLNADIPLAIVPFASSPLCPLKAFFSASSCSFIIISCNCSNLSTSPCVHCTSNFLQDRKSTRLNSSHVSISYAVFCLK